MASSPSLDFLPTVAPAAAGPPAVARSAPTVCLEERDWRSFQDKAELVRWDALAQSAAEPNPFFESWYLLPSLKILDPAGHVRLLRVEAGGQLVGVLPVKRERSYYGHPLPHWRTWLHPNAFSGVPLVAAGAEMAFWRALLAWADDAGNTPLFFHLAEMPLHGPLYEALREVLAGENRAAALVHRYERAMLQSDHSPRDYFEASVNAKRRKELRRREKRLAELGDLQVDRQEGQQGLDDWLDEFLTLERSGWKGAVGSALASREGTEALFRSAMRGAAERGRLERLTLRLDGRAIAILTTFITPPGAFGFKTAYDEAFARASPGVLLQREFLDLLDRSDIAWCDSCAAPDHCMIDHFWRERRPIGRINIALGGKARRTLFSAISRAETGQFAGALA